jgi:hypothetical protein
MTIKVDPQHGGTPHLVVGTEDLPPGKAISVHQHPHADKVVLLLQGAVPVALIRHGALQRCAQEFRQTRRPLCGQ